MIHRQKAGTATTEVATEFRADNDADASATYTKFLLTASISYWYDLWCMTDTARKVKI
jgi:hypothetical protein